MKWLKNRAKVSAAKKENRIMTCKKPLTMLMMLLLLGGGFVYMFKSFVFAGEVKNNADHYIYVDTSLIGADSEILKEGIGAYVYDRDGNPYYDLPVIMEEVEGKSGIYQLGLDDYYSYVIFTKGSDLNGGICTPQLTIDWSLGAPCFKFNSESLSDGGHFYGLYTVYFDLNNVEDNGEFYENGVGVYAYNSETERYSVVPVIMKASDKGEGIYEYSFDKPYKYIAFMSGYGSWDYEIATTPVCLEWGYTSPCFLLQSVDGKESTGLWRNLTCVVYFDASEVKEEEAFIENGVYLYAYNETKDGIEELNARPVRMIASKMGGDLYEYTMDKPFGNMQFLLGDSLDAEVLSEVVKIDWLSYASPCYRMKLERWDKISPLGSPSPTPSASPAVSPSATVSATPSSEPGETPLETPSAGTEETPLETPSAGAEETPLETPSVESGEMPLETPSAESGEPSLELPSEEPDATPFEIPTEEPTVVVPANEPVAEMSEVMTWQPESAANVLSVTSGAYALEWMGTEGSGDIIPGTVADPDESSPSIVPISSADPEGVTESDGLSQEKDTLTYVELTNYNPATTATVAADVGIPTTQSGASEKTIYFYTTGNGGWNYWTKGCDMYIHLVGSGMTGTTKMTKSVRQYTLEGADSDATLWEFTVDISMCQKVIFVNAGPSWTNDDSRQTVDVDLNNAAWAAYTHPCFALDGGSSGSKKTVKCLGDLGPLTQAGNSIYFYDMTLSLNTEGIYAVFCGDGLTDKKVFKNPVTGGYVIPDDVSGTPYTTIAFYDADEKQLGETYQFFNAPSDGEKGFLYDAKIRNTFYYGATEKADGIIISTWGEPLGTEELSLGGKKIYFSKVFFSVAEGGTLQIGKGLENSLVADADDAKTLSYLFAVGGDATSKTILTFTDKDDNKYHFMWNEFGATGSEINMVTLENDVAGVTEKYVKANTVYFDATMSKLSYSGTDGAKNNGNGIPYKDTEDVYYYATGSGVSALSGKMEKTEHGSWTDVYKVDLPEGYTQIRFAGYSVTNTNAAANGDGIAMWTIPTDLNNPCFYADTSDSVIYDGGNRSGYWAEVYTIRDAENYKVNKDIVDIPTSELSRKSEYLYVTSTFYDYYTDYELNGNNRDDYGGSNESTNRNWVNFRQFNQALSDYYEENSAEIPIYTGHFQPGSYNFLPFADMNATLQLYGFNNYNKFISTNNSGMDIYGNSGKYSFAAQGLVADTLKNGELIIKDGSVAEPHFDKDFLTGNNSKHAVLGEVYENVAFPFVSVDRDNNGVKYWYFNSAETTLAMRQDSATSQYYLADVGNHSWSQNVNSTGTTGGQDGVSTTYGFFPFNETSSGTSGKNYNYGFGTKLEFTFRLTEGGTVQDQDGNDVPITFEFSGDDDVWVFIDGKLALDVGGDHGRVTGKLNFQTGEATVDNVKASAGSTNSGSPCTTSFTMKGANTDEHTLTMFYMERGMWESNMMISFNFPDENQLAVEKQVDVSDVNQELFAGLFDGANIFSFIIRNQATHYAEKEADTGEEIKIVFNDSFSTDKISATSSNNIFEHVADWQGCSDVVHWKAKLNDAASNYRDKRYGVICSADGESMNVSGTQYLQFKYYYDEDGTPVLNHMYIAIEDTAGDVIVHSLSGRVYGNASMKSRQWSTLTVDLSRFAGVNPMNWTEIKSIKFGYDYEADFYLDDFAFKSASEIATLTGFVTKQYDIPDYGSATSGQLEYPVGAVYTLTTEEGESSYNRIGVDGMFVLADGDTALFRDQFRRGSYIYLEEEGDSDAFETVWTMYENGQAVATNVPTGTYNTVGIETEMPLVNRNSYMVDDGRAEVYSDRTDEEGKYLNNSGYRQTKSPDDPTFVFRSYASPDYDTGMTKLKVVYTNKVKTGSLTISKESALGSDPLEGEYTFLVTFTNIAGMALEGEIPITTTITLKAGESETIEGIPINTSFTITETASDKSYLYDVTEENGYTFTYDPETREVNGKITTDHPEFRMNFRNMLTPTINIEFEKKWENADGSEITDDLPESLTIRLQRREKNIDGTYGEWKDVTLNGLTSADILLGTGYERSWKYSFTDLDKYVDNTETDKIEWEYRIVEIKITTDENGNEIRTVVENDGLWEMFQATYQGPSPVSSGGQQGAGNGAESDTDENYEYIITNTRRVSIRVLKKDMATNEGIEGVSFQLQRRASDDTWENVKVTVNAGEDDEEVTDVLTTKETGICKFTDLPYGEYRLVEVKAKDGYTLLMDPIMIVLDREGHSFTVNGEAVLIEDNTISITVMNSQNLVLPPTGGRGPIPVVTGGLSLCSIAGFMYIYSMRKRRKEENSS